MIRPWNLWHVAAAGLAIGMAGGLAALWNNGWGDVEFAAGSLVFWPVLALGLGAIRNRMLHGQNR